ncbi:MAG TPA: hypothetical protein VNZ26_12730 [Vicinamibacterales bacterium]|nr:hypothetical protein [Vicinamibacterales bacterium]
MTHRLFVCWGSLVAACMMAIGTASPRAADTDLDAFMRQVLARRDDNWKKLQQYILDERETIDVRGPERTPLWGERRDYTWYIRDGFFVRSPVRFNGVEIGEADRRKYEAEFLRRSQERDKRRGRPPLPDAVDAPPSPPTMQAEGAGDVDGLLHQAREPQFVSSFYFLRFRFEEGNYALVGHETLDGRDLLRIEYYPTHLFRGTDRRRSGGRSASGADRDKGSNETSPSTEQSNRDYDAAFQRLMNKVALVTLWVEPNAHQIVKYTFDNIDLDFLPAQWLVHVDDVHATMTMAQPFPDVWLPHDADFNVKVTLAVGPLSAHYTLDYHDYRRPDVTTKVGVPKGR